MHVWKVCIRPDPEAPDLAQGYVLAADREDAFATVDHPDAEVFEADSAALCIKRTKPGAIDDASIARSWSDGGSLRRRR